MEKKYGKPIDMRKINRDLESIDRMIDFNIHQGKKNKTIKTDNTPVCRICGGVESRHYLTVFDSFEYYECANCGALFMKDLPDVNKMYSLEDSTNEKEYIDESIYKKRVEMISKPKVEFVLGNNIETSNIKAWVDIGCGGGEILYYLKHNTSTEGIGIEIDPEEIDFLEMMGLSYIKGFVDPKSHNHEIEKVIRNADVVSFINVLEHIEKPKEYINYLNQNMKPGALLVCEVPKHPSMASFVNCVQNDRVYRHICPPGHLQIFSNRSLEILLNKNFIIEKTWEFGQGYTDLINTLAMNNKDIVNNHIYDLIMGLNNEIEEIIARNGLADQILVVARKR